MKMSISILKNVIERIAMKTYKGILSFTIISLLSVGALSSFAGEIPKGKPDYPFSRQEDIVDTIHGVPVADPYRWLEYTDSADVQTWTDKQNALTRSYLDNIPARAKIRARLEELWNYPRQGLPTKCDNRYFIMKNDGLQNHYVLYAKKTLTDELSPVIDPNTWSADGTTAMDWWTPSKNGDFVAYGKSEKGAEQGVLYIKNVLTGENLPDTITETRYPEPAWLNDNSGFFYTRHPAEGTVPPGDENYYEKVYLHKLGENPENDELIFQRPDMKELGFGMQISKDDRYLVIYGYLGSSRKNEVYFKDLNNHGEIDTLISGFNNYYEGDIIDSILYLRTNENAPNFKIIAINLKNPNPDSAKEIISESDDMLSSFAIINNMLVVKYLHNAHSRVKIFDINGSFIKELEFPTLGSVGKPTGRWKDDEMFLSFSSFTYPRTIYRYDFNTGVLSEIYRDPVKVDPSGYVTKQVWYNSKDGTPVSMFIVHKEGMNLNGNNPALLTGYGGFTINETPYFSSSNYIWLENGGIFCLPNLRGGGEYGEKWHRDGMLENKQNVFDDFIAAAEWLISQGYTSPEKLAIRGGSNGGLLVGAALVQRPDLFNAVICSVPLLDMVRYHKFLIARYWIPEYGSSEAPEQFEYIYAYSPYHHVVKGTAYPAVFLKAGESDMRVHPSHARKMAAALQNATSSEAPILLDIERKTGHGQGQPISMQIEKYADNYAFLFWQLGMGE